MVTVEQVQEAVERYNEDAGEDEFWYEVEYSSPLSVGDHEFIYVTGEGGGEGGGEHVEIVFGVEDQLFRKTGFYSSYDGTSWDGSLEEVEPYEKMVTFYRPKK